MLGCSATVSSKSALVSPAFTAIAAACRISGESGPIMCKPDDLIGLLVDDHLVQRAFVAAREHIAHRAEIARVHADGAIALRASPSVIPTDAIGGCENTAVGMHWHNQQPSGLVAEHGVGKRLPLADRHRGQLDAVGDIAHRIDAVARRLVVFVDRDRALLVEFNPDMLQPQPLMLGTRPVANSTMSASIGSVAQIDGQRAVLALLDLLEGCVET